MHNLIERFKRDALRKFAAKEVTAPAIEGPPNFDLLQKMSNEWTTPDGKRTIMVRVWGGPEYGGMWVKEVSLCANTEGATGATMIRAQIITTPSKSEIEYTIHLDGISLGKDSPILKFISYFGSDDGRVHPYEDNPSGWRPMQIPGQDNIPDLEFITNVMEKFHAEGVYHVDELPQEIDTEATVVAFMEQLKRSDFSRPRLVLPKPKLTGST